MPDDADKEDALVVNPVSSWDFARVSERHLLLVIRFSDRKTATGQSRDQQGHFLEVTLTAQQAVEFAAIAHRAAEMMKSPRRAIPKIPS